MTFHLPPLRPYQEVAKDFIANNPKCGIFLSMGGGKSLTTLSALAEVRPSGHILVIAPLTIARSTWIDEIEKWQFPLRTKSFIVDENDRKLSTRKRVQRYQDAFTDPPTMYFINNELLTQSSQKSNLLTVTPGVSHSQLASDQLQLLDIVRTHGPISPDELIDFVQETSHPAPAKSKIRSWIQELKQQNLISSKSYDCRKCAGKGCSDCSFGLIDQMPIVTRNGKKALHWPFPTVIIDESQAFKNPSSQRFKALKRVLPGIIRLIELTGTPSPQGLLDLWSQIYLLDEGLALGPTLTGYRQSFFTPTIHVNNRPVKWELQHGADQKIHQRIAHLVMSAENTDLDLPDIAIDDVRVRLPKDVMAAYREFKRELVLDLVSPDPNDPTTVTITADNAAILHNKLVQYASGTMYTDSSKTGGRQDFAVIHEEKLAMADYLINNNGGSPVIIAHRYRSDREQLLKYLSAKKHQVAAFDGTRDRIKRWNAGSVPVMLIHPASAGHGLNLQDGGHTLIWYTLPDSLEHYQQTNARLHRMGQQHPVQVYRLISKGTQDEKLPSLLSRKQLTQDRLLDAVRVEILDDEDIEDIIGGLDISPL